MVNLILGMILRVVIATTTLEKVYVKKILAIWAYAL